MVIETSANTVHNGKEKVCKHRDGKAMREKERKDSHVGLQPDHKQRENNEKETMQKGE